MARRKSLGWILSLFVGLSLLLQQEVLAAATGFASLFNSNSENHPHPHKATGKHVPPANKQQGNDEIPNPPQIRMEELHKYINLTATKQSAIDHYAWPHVERSHVINDIAVFLLGTLKDTTQFGEPKPAGHGHDYFFERVLASRMTWARYIKHFYVVTGTGDAESRVLNNPQYCSNVTQHGSAGSIDDMHYTSTKSHHKMYLCANIHILHFPRCEGTAWGPRGPCCRCESAMKYFLESHRHHTHLQQINEMHHHQIHDTTSSSSQHSYPNWFVFADDDYWMRMHYLSSVLSHFDHNKAYALLSQTNFNIVKVQAVMDDDVQTSTNQSKGTGKATNDRSTDTTSSSSSTNSNTKEKTTPYKTYSTTSRVNMGAFLNNKDCKVPCAHRISWMGWGGFSIGALKSIEASIYNNGLEYLCTQWKITHDVGLGVFTWMHTLPTIPIKEGVGVFQSFAKDAIIWHKPFEQDSGKMSYDELFDNVWRGSGYALPIIHYSQYHFRRHALSNTNDGTSSGDGKGGGGGGTSHIDIPFDMTKYLSQEKEIGNRYMSVNRVFPNGGFKNTAFYKEMIFKQSLLSQLHESQHSKSVLDNSKVYQYKPQQCTQDLRVFDAWKNKNGWTSNNPSKNEPKMCLLYAAYMASLPLNQDVNNNTVPMLDQLIRI